jgi:ribosomal protein S8E
MEPFLDFKAIIENDRINIQSRIFFFKMNFDPFEKKDGTKQKEKKESKKEKSKKDKKKWLTFEKVKMILKLGRDTLSKLISSFRLDRFELNLDTGDYPLNAQLVPIFYHISNDRRILTVNFIGDNTMYLKISNKIGNILGIAIQQGIKFLIVRFIKK